MPVEAMVGGLIAAVNRATEAIKLVVEKDGRVLPPWAALIISILLSIFGCWWLGVNVFTESPSGVSFPPFFGILLTGMIVGLGSNIADVLLDILWGAKAVMAARAAETAARADMIDRTDPTITLIQTDPPPR